MYRINGVNRINRNVFYYKFVPDVEELYYSVCFLLTNKYDFLISGDDYKIIVEFVGENVYIVRNSDFPSEILNLLKMYRRL